MIDGLMVRASGWVSVYLDPDQEGDARVFYPVEYWGIRLKKTRRNTRLVELEVDEVGDGWDMVSRQGVFVGYAPVEESLEPFPDPSRWDTWRQSLLSIVWNDLSAQLQGAAIEAENRRKRKASQKRRPARRS